jgi:3-oxoacyl-[acyl-carrier protein] reductase
MILQNKTAIIYGGSGALGGAAARAFAAEGAHVFLAARNPAKLDLVVHEITRSGGRAEAAILDALDEGQVDRHASDVVAKTGGIDISLNLVGLPQVQGTPLADLSFDEFALPLHGYTRTNFLTAKAAARHMTARGSGVIQMISTPGSRMAGGGFLGYAAACASLEAMTRALSGELGPRGVRVVCLMSDAVPEALPRGTHAAATFQKMADGAGMTVPQMLEARKTLSSLQRMPGLREVGDTLAFLASDRAGAVTGTTVNMTCGFVVD